MTNPYSAIHKKYLEIQDYFKRLSPLLDSDDLPSLSEVPTSEMIVQLNNLKEVLNNQKINVIEPYLDIDHQASNVSSNGQDVAMQDVVTDMLITKKPGR